jgi:hypothetical protein
MQQAVRLLGRALKEHPNSGCAFLQVMENGICSMYRHGGCLLPLASDDLGFCRSLGFFGNRHQSYQIYV